MLYTNLINHFWEKTRKKEKKKRGKGKEKTEISHFPLLELLSTPSDYLTKSMELNIWQQLIFLLSPYFVFSKTS